jgi:hypothetical protein
VRRQRRVVSAVFIGYKKSTECAAVQGPLSGAV